MNCFGERKEYPFVSFEFPYDAKFLTFGLRIFSIISSYLCFFFLISLFINIFVPNFQGLFAFSVFLCRCIKEISACMEKKVILQKRRNKDMRKILWAWVYIWFLKKWKTDVHFRVIIKYLTPWRTNVQKSEHIMWKKLIPVS